MINKLSIGDLVCFNSAGMKYKTAGVILDFDFDTKTYRQRSGNGYVLVTCADRDWETHQITNA